jgi:hypothetical protein
MANDKKTKLSIEISTVDKATAKIKAINDRIDKATKPYRDFSKALSELREKSGLNAVLGGFQSLGNFVENVVGKLLALGGVMVGVVGAATAGLLHLVGEFDDLGDKAERLGVGVDFLAQMRYAAERSGAEVDKLDNGIESFSVNLGKARAGTGRMTAFLKQVSPELLKQLKATKGNEEALDLLANAMAKLEDPAKRAALAQATIGDSSLAPLLAKGAKGLRELRGEYAAFGGPQQEAAEQAGMVDDALKKLKASTDGVKAALVSGLGPAMTEIIDKLRAWFVGHRADIAEWAKSLGDKIPGVVESVASTVGDAVGYIRDNWGDITTFFKNLWNDVSTAFQAAWAVIKPIIDGVIWGAKKLHEVSGALKTAGGIVGDVAGLGTLDTVQEGLSNQLQGAGDDIQTRGLVQQSALRLRRAGVGGGLTFGSRILSADSIGALLAPRQQAAADQAKITIDIKNAPAGTRVSTDPKSTADVDLLVGYALGAL